MNDKEQPKFYEMFEPTYMYRESMKQLQEDKWYYKEKTKMPHIQYDIINDTTKLYKRHNISAHTTFASWLSIPGIEVSTCSNASKHLTACSRYRYSKKKSFSIIYNYKIACHVYGNI
jgi:hypothetical protein